MKRMFLVRFYLIVSLVLLLSFPLIAEKEKKAEKSPRPPVLTAQDTIRLRHVANPNISPDGQWIIYTKQTRDMGDNELKATAHIWMVRVDGSARRQMTFGEADCTAQAWFPDGKKIAFLSSRGKKDRGPKNQVFFMNVDGGEAWPVTKHKEGVQSFKISTDGKKICFTALDSLSKEEEKKRKEKDDAEVVGEKFRMSHLWIHDIEYGKEVRLSEGDFTVGDFRWSPDAKNVAYMTWPSPKANDSWQSDIWVIDLEEKNPWKLFENPGRDLNPRWSPDGQIIAFASDSHPYRNSWHNMLYLVSLQGGEPKILLQDFDLDFRDPVWSPDGKLIYWSTGDRTTSTLFAVDIKSGKVKRIEPPRGLNFNLELSRDGKRWVWIHVGGSWPAEVYTADKELKNAIRLSDANPWLREENIKLAKVETVTWKNSEGQEIEGVITWPVDYEPCKKYPLILNPHGGPSGVRIESFSSINQFFAGNGFMVIEPNFRGSSNYGQEFLNANQGYLGIRDYDDCMTGVDYCIEEGWADPEKLICYGWSYGGYMSFWIVTQTDRFKAVFSGAGFSNLYSMYSTTDIPGLLAWLLGTPWAEEEVYKEQSPINHVKNVKSPVLIMHGANDTRVPPTQAVEFYQALRDLKKDVIFVRYPREGHLIREPRHQMDGLRRFLFFFAKHVGLAPISDKE